MVIVKEIAPDTMTFEDGERLRAAILSVLKKASCVTVSFEGINSASSSFVNGSFVELLEFMSFEEIKLKVQVIKTNRQIADLIKRRLVFVAESRVAA
jgi:STAS-like domain of unknown function (DUF4325)